MAIFHSTTKIINRSSGRTSVGASAYRAGEKLTNKNNGITYDYTKKRGIAHTEIMIPDNAPKAYMQREQLWSAVERSEKRKDAQTAREIEIALPTEFNRQEQINIIKKYVERNFVSIGMCADIAIHDKKDGNPHVHIMLTTRSVNENGFGQKNRDWNKRENITEWRKDWAQTCNREFESRGIDERIDHRSYEEQGIDQLPTIHMGAAAEMENRGIKTDIGDFNRAVKAHNLAHDNKLKELDELKKEKRGQQAVVSTEALTEKTEKTVVIQTVAADGRDRLPDANQVSPATQLPIANEITDGGAVVADLREQFLTAEQAAEKLISLKTEYIELELQIYKQQNGVSSVKNEVRQIDKQIKNITEIKGYINSQDEQITRLYGERSKLGIFDGKKKRVIDGEITRYEGTKAQFAQELQRIYKVTPANINDKIQELQQQADTILKKGAEFDVISLCKRKEAIGSQYSQEMNKIAVRPDKAKIRELIATHKYGMNGLSIAERSAVAKAEIELNKPRSVTRQRNRTHDILI